MSNYPLKCKMSCFLDIDPLSHPDTAFAFLQHSFCLWFQSMAWWIIVDILWNCALKMCLRLQAGQCGIQTSEKCPTVTLWQWIDSYVLSHCSDIQIHTCISSSFVKVQSDTANIFSGRFVLSTFSDGSSLNMITLLPADSQSSSLIVPLSAHQSTTYNIVETVFPQGITHSLRSYS